MSTSAGKSHPARQPGRQPAASRPALAAKLAAGSYPVVGQPATTTAAMRAAADLIDRSGITGLSVTCADGHITIQVTASSGDAQTRAATVARLAGHLGATALREDSQAEACSWIRAHGTVAGLPVEVFTPLTVQEAGTGPRGQRLLLAAAPDGQIAQGAALPRLPAGWRWVTDLDQARSAAVTSDSPGHAAQIAAHDCPRPVTGAALQASASTPDPAAVGAGSTATATELPHSTHPKS